MAEFNTIARPYSQAAFAVAKDENRLDSWNEALRLIKTIAKDENIRELEDSPHFDKQDLHELLTGIGKDFLSATQLQFLKIVVENERLKFMPAAYEQFVTMLCEEQNTMEAEVTSPHVLDESEADLLASILEKKFGKKVKITAGVDESLLGGVIIKAGDMVIDSSLKEKINRFASQMGV